MKQLFRRLTAHLLVPGLLLGGACADPSGPPTRPDGGALGLTVQAHVTASVAGLTAEVTGPGIVTPIVVNLAISNGVATAQMTVPVGTGRVFTLHAFDATAQETHRGSKTVDIVAGTNALVSVTLVPLTGGVPIDAHIGTYTVTVSPVSASVSLGGTAAFLATVTDASGATIATSTADPASFTWASYNPVMVGIGADGLATGSIAGTTQVVANYIVGGFSGAAAVTVVASQIAPASLASDFQSSCAITSTRSLYCWGEDAFGGLGRGTAPTFIRQPVQVVIPGAQDIAAVSIGQYFTCALRLGGAVLCWGRNNVYQLGDGTVTDRTSPIVVPTPTGVTFKAITTGWVHACALSSAGTAYCWGRNASGGLGDGTLIDRPTPTPIPGYTFASITAGAHHTCGIGATPTTPGAVFCWGGNFEGQLGDGTHTSRSVPAPVTSGSTFGSVDAGVANVCAIETGGAIYCWGRNSAGELGDGTQTSRTTPTRVAASASALPAFAAVAISFGTTCARSVSDALYCWGGNLHGQLGQPATTAPTLFPTVISGMTAKAVGVGARMVCFTTAAGQVHCAGDDTFFQLGDPTVNGGRATFASILMPTGVTFAAP